MIGVAIIFLVVGMVTMFCAYPSDRVLTIGFRIFGFGVLLCALRVLVAILASKGCQDWIIWFFTL